MYDCICVMCVVCVMYVMYACMHACMNVCIAISLTPDGIKPQQRRASQNGKLEWEERIARQGCFYIHCSWNSKVSQNEAKTRLK